MEKSKTKPLELIWKGWATDIPDEIRAKTPCKIPEAGYVNIFHTGDMVVTKSDTISESDRRYISRAAWDLWDALPVEKKQEYNAEAERFLAEAERIS